MKLFKIIPIVFFTILITSCNQEQNKEGEIISQQDKNETSLIPNQSIKNSDSRDTEELNYIYKDFAGLHSYKIFTDAKPFRQGWQPYCLLISEPRRGCVSAVVDRPTSCCSEMFKIKARLLYQPIKLNLNV